MKEYQVLKKLKLQGEYKGMIQDMHGDTTATFDEYEVTIYDVPINKKEFCKPYSQIETKDGTKTVSVCANSNRSSTCNVCVNTAKKLYKMNGGK